MDAVKTTLALGTHPDDLELGCGATLAKLVAAGATVCVVIFADGRKGSPSGFDRGEETRTALASLGVQSVHLHSFRDTCTSI